MGEFMFVVKTFIFTLILVVIMQIKIGGFTIEEHSLDWLHESSVVRELQEVAQGAIRASKTGYNAVSSLFSDASNGAREVSSDGWLKIRRSEAYHKQREKELREEAKARKEERRAASEDREVDEDNVDYE